jgi:hypothetical protein
MSRKLSQSSKSHSFLSRHLTPILIFFALALPAQEHGAGIPDVLRGEVYIELEPIYGAFIDPEYPLDTLAAGRRALEEAAFFYSGMIYGWAFNYEIGERARRIPEKLELTPVAAIAPGDPNLRVTDYEVKDMRLRLWTDYRLSDAQIRRVQVWRKGAIRGAQALGQCPPAGPADGGDHAYWLEVRKAALQDAAREAIRAMLHGSERNRPKEAHGFIGLAAFPRYFIGSGRWTAEARFYVDIAEIIPFATY